MSLRRQGLGRRLVSALTLVCFATGTPWPGHAQAATDSDEAREVKRFVDEVDEAEIQDSNRHLEPSELENLSRQNAEKLSADAASALKQEAIAPAPAAFAQNLVEATDDTATRALATGADKSGVGSQTLALPQGSASKLGFGESFSAQPSTGVAEFTLPFSLPAARGAAQPSLSLGYSSGSSSDLAGVGWSVGAAYIARQTDRGVPSYDDRAAWHPNQDRFAFNDGQELVPICTVGVAPGLVCDGKLSDEVMPPWSAGYQYFRARVEGGFRRFFWSPDHLTWRVQEKSGLTMELGMPLDGTKNMNGVEMNPAPSKGPEIFRWYLVRQYDTYGSPNPAAGNPTPFNTVVYQYKQDPVEGQAYLTDIYDTTPAVAANTTTVTRFAHHTRLVWESRTDPSESYRSGWRTLETQRLQRVDVASKAYTTGESGARRMVRRYYLGYDTKFHASLLTSVTVEGRCGATETAASAETAEQLPSVTNCPRLPPLQFDYSHVNGFSTAGTSRQGDLPGYEAFDERIQQIGGDPPHSVDEDQADYFDVNADGLPDVMVSETGLYGNGFGVFFNSSKGIRNTFGAPVLISASGVAGEGPQDIELRDLNVLPLDLDSDGIVNLLHLNPGQTWYSVYTPRQLATGWNWDGRKVNPAGGKNPKLTFGDGGLYGGETRVVDVNADGLVDIVVSAGTELQTFLSLGRLPSGDGQFGSGQWASANTSTLSNDPIKTCLPAVGPGSLLHFSNGEYQFAEINGDGIPDIVRVYKGDIRFWPGRGNGFWGTGKRDDCAAGTIAERYVEMSNDEAIPDGPLKLDDVNGDGLDDLVRPRFDGVDIWLNVDGQGWSNRHTIDGTPANPSFASRVRLLDINGSGTRDIVWGNSERYEYIDLQGGARPRLLVGIKNGLGKSTSLEYTTSTQEMLTAEATGVACDALRKPWTSAWCSKMPTVVNMVKRVTQSDNLSIGLSGVGTYVNEYTYRDPVYEGRQREFRGFAKARITRLGDSNSPSDNTDTAFLMGECEDETPNNGISECSLPERWRDNPREALKGLPAITERYDATGRYLSTQAFSYRLRQLYTGLDGRQVRQAFQFRDRSTVYDTFAATTSVANDAVSAIVQLEAAPPAAVADLTAIACTAASLPTSSVTTTRTLPVPLRAATGYATVESLSFSDAYGNGFLGVKNGCVAGSACPVEQAGTSADEMICAFTTTVHPDAESSGWLFRSRLNWLQGSKHTELRSKTQTTYSAEGAAVKSEAWLDGGVPLARTTNSARSPAEAPPGVSANGAYITTAERAYDTLGNLLQEKGANGRCRGIKYEAALGALGYAQLPSRELYYRDGCPAAIGDEPASVLATIVTYDRGFAAMNSLTDMTVQRAVMAYDGLARLTSITHALPGGEAITASTLPTIKFTYDVPIAGSNRAYSAVKAEWQDGITTDINEYTTSYAFFDGMGRERFRLLEADPTNDLHPWIVSEQLEFDAKGAVRRRYLPYFNDSTPPAFPIPDSVPPVASWQMRYDAFDRQIQALDLDGTVTLQTRYHALSTDNFDAADLGSGTHSGTFATSQMDGHGRLITTTERVWASSALETRDTRRQYLVTGQPEVITRVRGSDQVARWIRYDTLGRMVLNVDPHATVGFNANPSTDQSALKTWRYAYNDSGDLVGTTDARGCGANYYYDNLGRLKAEEYSPCEASHADVTPLDPATGAGYDVVYEYDEPPATPLFTPPASYTQDQLLVRGKLRAVHDRAASTLFKYDARGRMVQTFRKIARIGATQSAVATRYVDQWFQKDYEFDAADRAKSETTGVETNSLLNASDGSSKLTFQYSKRGTRLKIGSSYGDVISDLRHAADGKITDVIYGDIGATKTHTDYDGRRRVSAVQTGRLLASLGLWSTTPATITPAPGASPTDPTRQLQLRNLTYSYDEVGNPLEIKDLRAPEDWPNGAKPITRRSMQYDDLYRLTRMDYQYPAGTDTFVSPYSPELNGKQDPRRAAPPGHKLLGTRPMWQTYSYDWLGNSTSSDDDQHAMYDRSVGTVTNDTTGKPYQFTDTSQQAAGGQHNGSISAATYDATGNLTSMQLTRSATACATALSPCSSSFSYKWDEIGRLVLAQRLDSGAPTGPMLQYAYDSGDNRVLKDVSTGGAPLTTAYIFDSLELRRAAFDQGTQKYPITSTSEVAYLKVGDTRLARIEYEPNAWGEPRSSAVTAHASNLHVLLEIPDELGSESVTIDQASSELIELRSYQPYGATEADYRPGRWQGFREDYGYTGKEEDIEVGLTYFGRRYYSPYVGRWISADPLAVHQPGSADLNLYAYVSGQPLVAIDPFGLEKTKKEWAEEQATYAAEGLDLAGNVMVEGFHLLASTTLNWGCECSFKKTDKILNDYARDRAYKMAKREMAREDIARRVIAREAKDGESFVKRLVDAGKSCWKDQNRCGLQSASEIADDFLKLSGKAVGEAKEAIWKLAQTARGHFIENILAKTDYKEWKYIGKGFTEGVDFEKGNLFAQLKTFDAKELSGLEKALKELEKLAAESPGRKYILDIRTKTQEQAEWILKALKSDKVQIAVKKW
jgi:RHS repeat-associated protein